MRKSYGFTLIEVMITVVIVAILASVAIPSYTQYVRKARRTEVTTTMLGVAAGLEKFLLANNAYPADITTLVNGGGGQSGVGNVGNITYTGTFWTTDSGNYWITITAAALTPRNVLAVAAGVNTPSPQDDDTDCQSFLLYIDDVKWSANSSSADSTATCWPD